MAELRANGNGKEFFFLKKLKKVIKSLRPSSPPKKHRIDRVNKKV